MKKNKGLVQMPASGMIDGKTPSKVEIKQALRKLLQETIAAAQQAPVAQRCQIVRRGLSDIQSYCKQVNKTFIACEIDVTCDQYGLGGSEQHAATLFRGPSEDASVAICVTAQGSLLHRNDSPWRVYDQAGDVHPQAAISKAALTLQAV